MNWKTGPRNSIADIAGLTVGNAQDAALKSGVTALLCDGPNVCSVHVMGGAPGTRETDLLTPENTVQSVDGIVLSGGSAFGLDAAGGVQQVLRKAGRGFAVGPHHIPIVPSAILFDLINGGEKDWGEGSPYRALGVEAANSADPEFETGSAGAGFGALTGGPAPGLKGGLGTASTELADGVIVAALVAVNALGSPVRGDGGQFRAADFEIEGEFGNFRAEATNPSAVHIKFSEGERTPGANTTIGIIATNAKLSKGAAKRLAVAAHDGFAHALWPAHTPLDGDLVFSLATGEVEIGGDLPLSIELSAAAGATMARAIARGVYDAIAHPNDLFPTWQDRFRPS